ncbi:sensor histidine kinase [Romboutsia lituseburensis]|uniref:sensor histidine kinase n=1 Tax=Romboutsia lituseburensis TaxID=1537 RepID=UPI00215A5533|nr:sensor histidine kinase [Romboutsia lituseburensis]MCR8744859.1 sensor histidine kinase [Romboutsia lituseburensis]
MNKTRILIVMILFISIGFKIDILAKEDYKAENKNILIINSYDSKNLWELSVLKGIQDELKKNGKYDINLNIEYLDSKKRSDEEYIDKFRELLKIKYSDINIDLIVTVDDESYDAIKPEIFNKHSIFNKKPLVFIGVNQEVYLTKDEKKYITGFIDSKNKLQIIDIITKLQPDIQNINILLDNTFYNEKIKYDIVNSSYLLEKYVKINFIQSNYEEEILSKVKALDKEEAIIISGVFKDKENNYIRPKIFVNNLKEVSNAPLYTDRADYAKSGIIGGYMDIGQRNGIVSAKMILRILDGESVENISLTNEPEGSYIFDYNEIYNYDIEIKNIPKGSIILNRKKHELLIPKKDKNAIAIILFIVGFIFVATMFIIYLEKKRSSQNKKLYVLAKEREKLKTDFIVNMSHEFRTPLNVIISICKLLEIKVQQDETNKDYLLEKINKINQNSNRLTRLINNLIDISKFEASLYECKFKEVNIVYVVEEVVEESIDFANQKNIDLIFDTEDEEIITCIDLEKIERAILNLLSNAIKFTNKNGKIEVYMKKYKENVSIAIKDNGIGMAKDKIEQIFHRFYQIDSSLSRSNEGSGVGLCIVDEIIKIHNGHINVYSQENKGSTFEVILPIKHCDKIVKDKSIKNMAFREVVKLEMSDIDK